MHILIMRNFSPDLCNHRPIEEKTSVCNTDKCEPAL
jgi:hypothetical protein